MQARTRPQPQRTCVSCREAQDKRGLVRLVRADDRVTIDETGRANGRGAYLCTDAACWRKALRAGTLARALKVGLAPEDRASLEAYAARLERLEATTADAAREEPTEGSNT